MRQSQGWSAGYGVFVALCIGAALYSLRSHTTSVPAETAIAAMNDGPRPTFRDFGLWLLLSAMGSFMLLAVTNHITHDVASVPFLWILPLTIYLITFILCFEGRGWYRRYFFIGPLLVVVGAMAWALHAATGASTTSRKRSRSFQPGFSCAACSSTASLPKSSPRRAISRAFT